MGAYEGKNQVVGCECNRRSEEKTRVVTKGSFAPGEQISVRGHRKRQKHGATVVRKARDFYNSENKFTYRHIVLSRNCEDAATKCYEVPYVERKKTESPPTAPAEQKKKWGTARLRIGSFLAGLVGRPSKTPEACKKHERRKGKDRRIRLDNSYFASGGTCRRSGLDRRARGAKTWN